MKELLETVLYHLENKTVPLKTGLCMFIIDLQVEGVIAGLERQRIQRYLTEHGISINGYWFTKGHIAPRIGWLKKRIEIENDKK